MEPTREIYWNIVYGALIYGFHADLWDAIADEAGLSYEYVFVENGTDGPDGPDGPDGSVGASSPNRLTVTWSRPCPRLQRLPHGKRPAAGPACWLESRLASHRCRRRC